MNTSVTLNPGAASISISGLPATVSIRADFAVLHLRAAARAAISAYEVERANATEDHGEWVEEMACIVPISVVMAAAALEANASEIIQDILDGSTTLPLTKGCELLLKEFKEDKSGNALDKYRRIALLFNAVPNTGESPWQEAQLLTNFRNYFMHFRPTWDHGDEPKHKLFNGLKAKIPISRTYRSSSHQFPHGFMTYGCAKWSVFSVLAFSRSFTALLGVNDTFADPLFDFSLPG